ncbi:hypothetical protein GHT06_012456 [Daphnia sinensis]|uniref:Uncharacterized protein n=1 Tax=Daphnia sinensis TaxID=1820382 RepID=A0AAD5LPB4_9CRUS|nr:hypothetical protein GHT06_012456 [Daphnia sinensis]
MFGYNRTDKPTTHFKCSVVFVAASSFPSTMPRLFYILLLGVAVILIDLRGTHSSAIDSKVEGEHNAKTIANQTADVQSSKVRQVEDVIPTNRRQTLEGVIDDETTHLFFGEANSFANNGNVRTFPADAFGTLLIPTTTHPADAPAFIPNTNEPVQEVQAVEVNVPVLEIQPHENPTGDAPIVDNVSESFAGSRLDSTIHQVQDEATAESIAISKIDELAPEISTGGQSPQFDQATHIGQSDSFLSDSRTEQSASQITHVQETEIGVGDHSNPFSSNSGEPKKYQMEHKGDVALELNPNTNDRVNLRSQTTTNLSGRGRHLPMVKVKQVFNIHVQPSASFRPLPRAHWKQDDSSIELVLNDRAPVQLETGQFQQEPQVPSGFAQNAESNLGNVDSFVMDGPAQVQPEPIDHVIVSDAVPIEPIVQVSPVEQGTHSGGTDSFIVISAEQSHKDADVDVILAIRPEAQLGTAVFQTTEDVAPMQPEINVGRADVNTEIQGGTQHQLETNISEQPADKQNQISEERLMRSAFASIASQSQQSSNHQSQKPINLNRNVDGDVDEPNISIEILDKEPNPRVGAKPGAVQRNRTVVVEVDDGFVSSEIVGQIDENRKIHLHRPTQEQETPLTKAPRRNGNRQESKVTIEQIQTALNEKDFDQLRDDSSVERVNNSPIQSRVPPSRNSDEQDDRSLEVNIRLLSKIKRIMRPELRKQPKRPKMEFFQHSEEQNDVSSELNDILANPLFQQKIHEMDARLQSAPEARGKRLMKKYAEALALSSSSSTPIINSFLPFLIACLLVCW